MKSTLFSLAMLAMATVARPQDIAVIPAPLSMKVASPGGHFSLSAATVIVADGIGPRHAADFFNDYLEQVYHFRLRVLKTATASNRIRLRTMAKATYPEGAYSMTVGKGGISITGDNDPGTFYGMQTLIQLLPVTVAAQLPVPFVTINDAPRFAYRGLMLDVCRHFFPIEFVKRYLDFIALHKMNYFHWHLTDDQGWRIEIKKYPKLTEVGAYRNGTLIGRYPGKGNDNQAYGGFYTQDEVKDIVRYAADRFITVIPEIEMPGHSSAAIAAYPELSCFPDTATVIPANMISTGSKEQQASGRIKLVQETWGVFRDVYCPSDFTFGFLQDVIDEIIPLFPAKYIHVGGDECPKDAWKASAFCQQLIKDNHLTDEHGLQSYFISRMEKYINSKGKQIIGWDEILEGGLAPNATVMSWRGEEGGIAAAKENHDVVMTPGSYVYFDHAQAKPEDSVTIGNFLPLDKVYSYQPIPAALNEEQGKHVLGAQANLWTEYIANTRKAEYMLFPRVSALSEVLWSPAAARNFSNFEKRMTTQTKRYDLWNINYYRARP